MVESFCHVIDTINERVGKIVAWLFIPLMLLVVMEVTLRYVFNNPTLWGYDVMIQLQGVLLVLAGGYTLLQKGHVAVDIFVSKFPPRKRALIDMITGLLLISSVGLLLWRATLYAWRSWLTREMYISLVTYIYPFKIIMVVGILMLFLQGVSEFTHNLITFVHREKAVK